jgi:NADPH:quinone reductase-like Zn-dependent oxidoreductase
MATYSSHSLFNGFPGYTSGTYQEYSLQPVFAVGKAPEQLSDLEAVTIPVGSATALAVFKFLEIPPPWENPSFGAGKAIFIPGGASSVGQFAIQLARLTGFTHIFTTGSPHNEALLHGLGATTFIDRNLTSQRQVEQVFDVVGSGTVPFVADAVSSAESLTTSFAVAQKNSDGTGKVGAVLFIPEDIITKYPDVQCNLEYMFGNVRGYPAKAAKFFEHLPKYVAEGLYKPNPFKVVGTSLEDVPAGIELMKRGVSGQKLVISYQVLQ